MQRLIEEYCHHVPAGEVLDLLGVDPKKGLDLLEIGHRRERIGPNRLTERKGRHPLVHFLIQFHQPLVYILLAAALVTLLLEEYVDSAVIFGVVLVNAVVGFIQEAKALKAIQALARSLSSSATVLRAEQQERIPAEELVPGDIVLLQSGDRVPADLRLLQVRDLQINESALTGEPIPAQKSTSILPRDTTIGDRTNMVYSSTLVTYGTATGVVVATGDATEIGRISEMIAAVDVLQTPLTKKIHAFSKVLLFVVLGLAALAFAAGVVHGQPLLDMFMASVALAVGAIPEGLPAAVTIIMAIGVSRMAQRRAIIRRLPAVETLGSTTVICSDKTGTLTQNQMTVSEIVAGGERFTVSGAGYAPVGQVLHGQQEADLGRHPPLDECLRCGLLCSDARLLEEQGTWKVQGDPTEGALVSAARKAGLSPESIQLPRLDSVPFESQHQYMATLHDQGPDRPRLVYIKGALENLLPRCRAMLGPAGELPLEPDLVRREGEAMAQSGLRVLAFARRELPAGTATLGHPDVAGELVFLGLQGMLDPPRPEVTQAVANCQNAGVKVKMITGDHAFTASSIARQIGIVGTHDAQDRPAVLSGQDIAALSERELIDRVEAYAVFARVSPEHKLRLVEALQARGHVVAMTGDGVNDAPALRRANIGVAMALGGTEVAREASDMVLTDDNFASIEAAVEEGRGVFDNLQKFIVWTLPTNGGEALVLLLAILLGLSLPILPVQILWVNMMTAVFLGMTLAFEPKERGIMERRPNPLGSPILNAVLIWRIVLVSVLLCLGVFGVYEWELSRETPPAVARTAAVNVLVFGELFYLFNCRSQTRSFLAVGLFSNRALWGGIALMILAQLLFTYLPVLNRLFGAAPLPASSWAPVLGASLAASLAVGLEKWIRNRRAPRAA